jgi:phosphoglycerol transferase MdoB-like AlkP superfamily enzyme
MRTFLRQILSHRFGLLALITFLLLIDSFMLRTALLLKSAGSIDFTPLNLIGIYSIGLFYDLVNTAYFIVPFVLLTWLIPNRFFVKPWHRYLSYTVFYILITMLLFNSVSEWLFWDEFNSRYNFIAVDYLIYTTEVMGNIRQSYPVEWITAGILTISGIFVYWLRPLIDMSASHSVHFRERTKFALILLLVPVISFFTVSNKLRKFSQNALVNELSGNGLYELFAAYLTNELDFEPFYQTEDVHVAFSSIHQLVQTKESRFVDTLEEHIDRLIVNDGPEKKWNVVLISIESFSADFMGSFGNKQNITPFLDSLAGHSLLFTRLYATGTRTVRGLEALSLCVPPTPGQSIVRRPHNENLFTLARVFNSKGYESKFIYGGYGYFDNMNYFFSHNGYRVIDRQEIPEEEIAYENIWGVADENLFDLAITEIDKTVSNGNPVFAHIMTTSNHRPYTYPEGRIDIPPGSGRHGAVKYTDYAVGRFIRSCRTRPWFNNTLFVITADHCASSAGKTELPVNKYHIPMIIYSPQNIQPARVERMMSQIDVGPTLLGLLNFTYTSKFFGYDIFKLEEGRERVFVSTYQNLGFLRNDKMVVLSPKRIIKTLRPDIANNTAEVIANDPQLVQEAITWYQTASYNFKHELLKTQ